MMHRIEKAIHFFFGFDKNFLVAIHNCFHNSINSKRLSIFSLKLNEHSISTELRIDSLSFLIGYYFIIIILIRAEICDGGNQIVY